MIVLTVPTPSKESILAPIKQDHMNLGIVLLNLEKLRCHMHDDSVISIALANKLVSLFNQPSNVLLEKFTAKVLKNNSLSLLFFSLLKKSFNKEFTKVK